MMAPGDDSTATAGEFDLIRWIRSRVGETPGIPIGIGDDCAALNVPAGRQLLVTTDMVIAGVHFAPETATPRQIGHKAVARGLSDIAAMAGDPLALVIACAVPRGVAMPWLHELFLGMKDAADACGAPIVGGDISTGELPLTVTVTALGTVEPQRAVLRSGARAGDVVVVTGEFGGSILGRHLSFLPRLAEARWLRSAARIHSMIDVSDGLAADASHVAEESAVGIELWEKAIPVSEAAARLAARTGRPPLEHALHDGEDYELFFTLDAREAERLLSRKDAPVRLTCIGDVVAGAGLRLQRADGTRAPLAPKGWVHRF